MPYRYQVHGLTLECDFPLPELTCLEGPVAPSSDIYITEGAVPRSDLTPTNLSYLKLCGDASVFELAGAGRFLVRDGKKVVIERAPDADERLLRLFLFGSVMGMLTHQRGLLPLHASAVAVGSHAVAFTGHPGAGKSTLAAHCVEAGAELVADDVLVLSDNPNAAAFVYPGMPALKLWRDALARLDRNVTDLQPDWWRADKFHLPMQRRSSPLQLARLYVLVEDATAGEGASEALSGRAAAEAVIANTYRLEYLDAFDRRDVHFRHCIALASNVSIQCLRRDRDPALLPRTARSILDDLGRFSSAP